MVGVVAEDPSERSWSGRKIEEFDGQTDLANGVRAFLERLARGYVVRERESHLGLYEVVTTANEAEGFVVREESVARQVVDERAGQTQVLLDSWTVEGDLPTHDVAQSSALSKNANLRAKNICRH